MMKCVVWLMVLWLGLCWAVCAKEPESLSKLRRHYEVKANVAAAELKRFYAAKLDELEGQLVAAGDYAQAKAVRAEGDALRSISQSEDSVIALALDEAQVTALKEEEGALTDWKSTSVVEWSALRVPEGEYRVEIELSAVQSASELPDGELILEEVSELNLTQKSQVVFKLKDLPRSAAGGPVKLSAVAVLDLRRMPVTLRLGVSKAIKTQEITLYAVDLVLKPKPLAATAKSVAGELTGLLAQQQEQLNALEQRHVKVYQAELQKLAEQAVPELKEQVKVEMERLAQSAVPVARRKGKLGVGGEALGLDQLTELEGARYVKDAANRGDFFKIEHGGKSRWIKLALVLCPPLEPTPSHALKQTVERFRVSPTDAVSLGESAAEFTEFQLKDQPLRVLVREREKGKEKNAEAEVALVFVPAVGLLQNLLIDVGLAVVDEMPVKQRSPLKRALEEREQHIRNSPTPLGGWALSQSAK
jgi:hypothetical protein